MILRRDAKILRFQLSSISVKKKNFQVGKEKITFFLNNIEFETDRVFTSEKSFLDNFLTGRSFICKHEFKGKDTTFENVAKYIVFYENGFVMIVLI